MRTLFLTLVFGGVLIFSGCSAPDPENLVNDGIETATNAVVDAIPEKVISGNLEETTVQELESYKDSEELMKEIDAALAELDNL